MKKDTWRPCGKASYNYRTAARAVARQQVRRKIELRQYHCEKCGKYHVTGVLDWDKHVRDLKGVQTA